MFFALMLAAATASAAPKAGAPARSLDMVPAFVSACMSPGPEPDKIKAAVVKAGGVPAPQAPGSAPPAAGVQGYLFANSGVPFSVIFDKAGTCSMVAGQADIAVTRSSLDRLVIGSSQVFDISQTDAKPHAAGEEVVVEYRLTSKGKNAGLQLTLSRVTREGKGTAVFLTRRVFSNK